MWTHTIRKAFRKIVRQTNIDDDDKEQLMGHVIQGSRESYYDKKDVGLIMEAYQQCNFSRELPDSEVAKLQRQLDDSRLGHRSLEKENEDLKRRIANTETKIESLEKLIREALKQD